MPFPFLWSLVAAESALRGDLLTLCSLPMTKSQSRLSTTHATSRPLMSPASTWTIAMSKLSSLPPKDLVNFRPGMRSPASTHERRTPTVSAPESNTHETTLPLIFPVVISKDPSVYPRFSFSDASGDRGGVWLLSLAKLAAEASEYSSSSPFPRLSCPGRL